MKKVLEQQSVDIDGPVGSSSIKAHFDKKIINENLSFRQKSLRKNLDEMMDQIERYSNATKENGSIGRTVQELGGDMKLLGNMHKEFDKMYDDIADLLMSSFMD